MHTLSAFEVKRRGVVAIEEALKEGPVHIIKNNRPVFVVLSEEDYAQITQKQKLEAIDLWDLLDHRPWEGQRSKENIDRQIQQERNSWNE